MELFRTLAEKVAPGRAALVTVDVQNDVCHQDGVLVRDLRHVGLPKATQITGAAETYKITPNGEIDTTVFIGIWTPEGKVQVIRAWNPPKID